MVLRNPLEKHLSKKINNPRNTNSNEAVDRGARARGPVDATTAQATLPPSRELILSTLRAASKPVHPDELATELGVSSTNFDLFERRLKAMERDGQVMPNRKGFLLVASKLDFTAGRVLGHRDGFGFLIPDDGGPDIVLSTREMRKVMHGDRVLVKLTGHDKRGKPEGTIVEVTQRTNRQLVGRFLNERGVAVVVPEDNRIKHDILIPPADTLGAEPGQVVMVEIVEQPSGYTEPIGSVVKILGGIDDPGMEIEIAVRKFDVPHEFPEAALSEAAALPLEVKPGDLRERIDLRDVSLVTIDGEDARDFDDAVYCEPIYAPTVAPKAAGASKTRNSTSDSIETAPILGWRLLVAIADVSHYVRPGSALDQEATKRSTSVYFPRRVIPMLPEKISNGLCSLNPQVDRLVMVCDMVVSLSGVVTAYQFYNAVMHSEARLTYDEVWDILSGRDALAAKRRAAVVPHLKHLYEVFHLLLAERARRGAIDFDTTETKIVCDANGKIEKIVPRHRNDAHRLIEECMLAANVCAANFIDHHKRSGLFRVHEGPTPEKLTQLREFLRTLGLRLGASSAEPSSLDYAILSKEIRDRPDAALLQTMLLRSMQQAIYTPDNSGHFGLSYDAYTHFTSPIRRYPDLLVHRVIKSIIAGKVYEPVRLDPDLIPLRIGNRPIKRPATKEETQRGSIGLERGVPSKERTPRNEAWDQYGMLCSANERRADEASRDVESWLKCQYMRNRVGEEFRGRITGVAPFGVFVTLEELYVEGMVHVSELGSEYFQYNEANHEMRGERTGIRYRLTDELDVFVSRVDLEARRIEFGLVQDRPSLEPVGTGLKTRQRAAKGMTDEARAAREARLVEKQDTRPSQIIKDTAFTDLASNPGKRTKQSAPKNGKSAKKSAKQSAKKTSGHTVKQSGRKGAKQAAKAGGPFIAGRGQR